MPTATPLPELKTAQHPPDLSQKLPKLVPRRRRESDQAPSQPPPRTPPLRVPPKLEGVVFTKPTRRILSSHDHNLFIASDSYQLIVSFVFTLSDSVRNTTVSSVKSSPESQDPTIIALLSVLDEAVSLLKANPPLDTGSRFGNPAFRDYLAAINNRLSPWHARLGIESEPIVSEVSTYLANSFGNSLRIDYGSGHELNFILWLLCLHQLSMLPVATFPALALIVFPRYLALMRSVQSAYYLEPAGSHGVWGLDDYQFLPFLFGASQLVDHRHLRPLSIHQELTLEECAKDFLYFDQVRWVNATKTVQGLRWHSPMLDDISAAKSWAKIEAGLRKMFLADVLGKLPVAQHFLFGTLLSATEGMSHDLGQVDEAGAEISVDGMRHVHVANSWGDCCGIKVPSAVGARQELEKIREQRELRRLPFD